MFAPQRYHNALQKCEKPHGDWQPATYPLHVHMQGVFDNTASVKLFLSFAIEKKTTQCAG